MPPLLADLAGFPRQPNGPSVETVLVGAAVALAVALVGLVAFRRWKPKTPKPPPE